MCGDYTRRTLTDVLFAPLEGSDLLGALFVGVALLLGPDFLLAPAGLVSDDGIRPGYSLESVVGRLIDPSAQWLADRDERLAAKTPLSVRAAVVALFVGAGLLTERLLLLALEDTSFVISLGICGCIGGEWSVHVRLRNAVAHSASGTVVVRGGGAWRCMAVRGGGA